MKPFTRFFLIQVILFGLCAASLRADPPSPSGGLALDTWSFSTTNWLSDSGFAPFKFTNLVNVPDGGDGNALLLDTSNTVPAYLVYKTFETDGTNELSVPTGTFSCWFNPRWSGTNAGGAGPGAPGRLFELGAYTTNASYGWLSLYLSPDGTIVYFAGQTNNGSQGTYLSAPVHFVSNNWYNLVLTYGPTNCAFYTNGVLLTNGTGVAYYPSAAVQSNGFSIGSSVSNVVSQARGLFDDVATYNYQVDPGTISGDFEVYELIYGLDLDTFTGSAPSVPSVDFGVWGVVTGPGETTYSGAAAGCVTNTNFWLTNLVVLTNTGVTVEFTVMGGAANTPYDLYGSSPMTSLEITNTQWYWLGQVYGCGVYTLTNQPIPNAVYLLANTWDSDNDGLPDSYELLVSHTSPHSMFSNPDGVPEGWKVLHKLNPETAGISGQDPDHDGLTNGQEYLYGTDPWVSEGWSVWVGNSAGYMAVP